MTNWNQHTIKNNRGIIGEMIDTLNEGLLLLDNSHSNHSSVHHIKKTIERLKNLLRK